MYKNILFRIFPENKKKSDLIFMVVLWSQRQFDIKPILQITKGFI